MSKSGLISIIIPTYNRAKIIGKTLDSIKAQTFENWECIIVDDGSTDETSTLVQEYLNDERFVFLSNQRTKGAPGARNTGLLAAQGEFIYFFDSDNIMLPEALNDFNEAIRRNDADVFCCFAEVLNDHDQIINHFTWKAHGNISTSILSGDTYVDYNISIIRSSALKNFGFMDEECPSYQEWDAHIRLGQYCTYHTVEKSLIQYYQRDQDTISSDKRRSSDGFFYVLNKHANLFKNLPDVFKKQGAVLLQMAESTNDEKYIDAIRNNLIELIPKFKSYMRTQRIKNFFQKR